MAEESQFEKLEHRVKGILATNSRYEGRKRSRKVYEKYLNSSNLPIWNVLKIFIWIF
jgi:hypothetical protein